MALPSLPACALPLPRTQVNLVRCIEPLASVGVGLLTGKRYSLAVLATLLPICGGVLLASCAHRAQGLLSWRSVVAQMHRHTPRVRLCSRLDRPSRRATKRSGQQTGPSPTGVALALLSNVCFCMRPLFTQRLKAHPVRQSRAKQ